MLTEKRYQECDKERNVFMNQIYLLTLSFDILVTAVRQRCDSPPRPDVDASTSSLLCRL